MVCTQESCHKYVDVKDLDTAHRVPAREASNRPNAIICKFISRLTRDEVMARRNEVRNLRPENLSFDSSVNVDNIRLYDHLIPRVQELLFKAKKFQRDNGFAFCWAKNGSAFLRRTESSRIIKLSCIKDLTNLASPPTQDT